MTEQELQEIREQLIKAKEHFDLYSVPYTGGMIVCESLLDEVERLRKVLEEIEGTASMSKEDSFYYLISRRALEVEHGS